MFVFNFLSQIIYLTFAIWGRILLNFPHLSFSVLNSVWNKKEIVDSKEEIISVFRFSIFTIQIIVSIWFVYDLSLNYKFINSVVKVFFTCIFKMYHFYQFITNLVQIGEFMLFPKIINNNKNTVVKNGNFEICNGSCCHGNCSKIINLSNWELCTPYRLWRCKRDCLKTIQMKLIKYYRKQ